MAVSKKATETAKPKKPRKYPMTKPQRALIKGIAEGKTQKEAAKLAGLNESYASQVLNTPKLKIALVDLMDKMGLSDDVLLAKHKELLNATRKINDEEIPEYQIQAKALEMGYKLKSAFVEKSDVNLSGTVIHKIQRTIIKPE